MTGVSGVAGPAELPLATSTALTAAASPASLVPAPQVEAGSMESIYVLMSEVAAQAAKTGKSDVESNAAQKREAYEQFKKALAKAAEEKSSGVFKTIATVGMVAAAAAATVASCGTAAPAVVGIGVALSTSGFVVGETKCLDPLLGDGASMWVGMGMGLCGTAVTIVGPGAAGAGATLDKVASLVEHGSNVARGCQQIEDAVHTYRADEHTREAKSQEQQIHRLEAAVEEVVARLQEAKDTSRRGSEAVSTIVETQGQTLIIASGGRA